MISMDEEYYENDEEEFFANPTLVERIMIGNDTCFLSYFNV